MTTPTDNTKSKTELTSNSTGYEGDDPSKKDPKPEVSAIDQMYPPVKKDDDPEGDPPADEKKPDEKKPEDIKPATGYDDDPEGDPPADEKKPDEKKPDEKKPDEKKPEGDEVKPLTKEEVDSSLGDLPEGYNKEGVSEFAIENKMTKEQVEAYVKFAIKDNAQLKDDSAAQLKAQRKAWSKELKEDPEFGGENYDANRHKVEQTLEKYLPNFKKVLTDKKGMVPPYLMRDLLGIAKALDPTTEFTGGDPSKPAAKEPSFLDVMYPTSKK